MKNPKLGLSKLVKRESVKKEEPIKIEMLQCPYCIEKAKTTRVIKRHISRCGKNPLLWGSPYQRGIDSKGRIFEKRPR